MCTWVQVLPAARESIRCPGAGIMGHCKPPISGCLQKPHVLSTAEASLQPLLRNPEPWPWDRQAPNTHIVPHDVIYGRRIEQLTSASVSPHLRGDP